MKININKGKVSGTAVVDPTDVGPAKRECSTCGGGVRRSRVTGVLHHHCSVCRYLRMIYGPSISVRRS